jgi:enoyl-CoA hydratase/carnithine racemase
MPLNPDEETLMSEQVRVERDGRVVVATLDNPPHGLMTGVMVSELDALSREADADDGIGAVVLTGAHPERFLAHYDVRELLAAAKQSPSVSAGQARAIGGAVRGLERLPRVGSALGRTPAAGVVELHAFHALLSRLGQSGAVWIAAINGAAMGGGSELSLACDLRMISADGLIGQPEILLGFPPGGGGTQRLSRLIGRARALEIMLEGRPVSAEEALEIGMVHRVVEPEALLDAARETAERLARRPKAAVAALKRAVLEGGSLPLATGLRMEQSELLATLASEPAVRAMTAYVEQLERTGEVPAYDEDTRQKLLDGTFVDMNA